MDLFGDLPPPSAEPKPLPAPVSDLYGGLCTEEKKPEKRPNNCNGADPVTPKKSKLSTSECFTLKSYLTERKGEREDMQDSALLLDDCTKDFLAIKSKAIEFDKASFIGVFDGHGGCRASYFAKENLQNNILQQFPKEHVDNFDRELKRSIIQAFKDTDEAFIKQASKEKPPWKDGSTASCILLINNTVYVANIGDSKAVLVRQKIEGKNNIVTLTKDHSPTDYNERQRIQNAGGIVRDGRVQGVLEVSRAFGDARFKKYVICTPDVFKSTLTDNDRYIIMACDGLWKSFTSQDAVAFIDKILEDESIDNMTKRYEKASKEIANEAVRRCSGDNVTVILIRIQKNIANEK